MNRNRLIAGLALLAVLIVLAVLAINKWKDRQPRKNQRSPVSDLSYCSSNNVKLCIVSFSLDADGNMLVNVRTPGASFPDFNLKIRNSKGESLYKCKKVKNVPGSVYCTGEEMHPGEALQFMIVSRKGGGLLAQGSFAIIGLAFSSPQIVAPTPSQQPTEVLAQGPIEKTPLPSRPTPQPSYPNPSYPNP